MERIELMDTRGYLSSAFAGVLKIAQRVSADVSEEVEKFIKEGLANPLSKEEAKGLFMRIATTIRKHALQKGDRATAEAVGEDIEKLLTEVLGGVKEGKYPTQANQMSKNHSVHLQEYNGIKPVPVIPRPWFHAKEVPMNSGYVKTTDIQLWDENVRLDIHVGQFKEKYGRVPSAQELLDIMFCKLQLPGVTEDDQFEIIELARSIAINGVRKPPIIDIDGTLLDGNRRVAACYFILSNDEFSSEQKKRAEYIFVWQLLPDATDDDRTKVIVSLNFEPDYKEDWPEYVKAQAVYRDWGAMLTVEHPKPGPQRQAAMKRELSQRYALGPDSTVVNRYLKMVEWANEFEDHHIVENKKDKFAVQHTSSKYFQYFDEISKGASPGGVAYSLNQDESFKKLVFDILYEGKFRNWNQIRKLRYIADNDEARDRLRKAREHSDIDEAKDFVEEAIAIADTKRADKRSLGANTRIETFIKWLEELPVKTFRDEIRPENLQKLLDALMLVKEYAKDSLNMRKGDDVTAP